MTSESAANPAHLLLVDDDRLILATLSRGLQDVGYRVSCAESAEEAQEMLTSGLRPDLALLDVRLPGADGLSLAQRLCELDHIPFVMLSAYSDEATVQRAANLGALGYLVKPLDTASIRPTLEAALQRARETRPRRSPSPRPRSSIRSAPQPWQRQGSPRDRGTASCNE